MLVASVGLLIWFVIYLIDSYTTIDLSMIGRSVMYGFFGLAMAFMAALIMGIMLKSVWINIMRRTDNIGYCCPDANNEGVHVIGSHYFPGGENTDGYTGYHHYYIRLSDGKIFLSKKINDFDDITQSLEHLKQQTKIHLKPRTDQKEKVGSNTGSDDTRTQKIVKLPSGKLIVQGFESLLDEGFRISYVENERVRWKRTI
jgi:hypothetical protein